MTLNENDVINLTNKAKRQAVLDAWRDWPIWASVPEIGLTVHKLDLPGGGAFTASLYAGDQYKVCGTDILPHPMFHMIGYSGMLASGCQAESVLIDELMALRKKLLEERK